MRRFDPFTSDEEISTIGRGLLDRTLPKTAWTHAAHFAATLWLLRCRPDVEISREMPGFIHSGVDSCGSRFFVTCNELMGSRLGSPEWLLEYWTRSRLFSVEARRAWVEPDIKELPF
jgi:hypothetical protein